MVGLGTAGKKGDQEMEDAGGRGSHCRGSRPQARGGAAVWTEAALPGGPLSKAGSSEPKHLTWGKFVFQPHE